MDDLFSFVEQQAKKSEQKVEKPSVKSTKKAVPLVQDSQRNVLTVSELSNDLRKLVEGSFGRVAVEGEISSLRVPGSGHGYFRLKDENSNLNAVIWRGSMQRLKIKPEDGMHVVAYGTLTTYGARSEYQMVVDKIEPAGLGALMQMLEERKTKLAAEGLFDESRKKPIPFLPEKIGIVTSPTGAVIEDIMHRLQERCPRNVLLWPTLVQGEGAAEKIAAAVKGFNDLPNAEQPDVVIVARGGGSLEDLWAFNEEVCVRAIAASEIPVITGVGHEPDTTLVDYVSDKRAPTPTAAAEMAVPVKTDLLQTLDWRQDQLQRSMLVRIENLRNKTKLLMSALPHPQKELNQMKLRLDDRTERLTMTIQTLVKLKRSRLVDAETIHNRVSHKIQRHKQRLETLTQLLESYSPEGPLKRGYAYVTDGAGKLVRSAKNDASNVTLHFGDGERKATLEKNS